MFNRWFAASSVLSPWRPFRVRFSRRGLSEDYLSATRVNSILDRLWKLEDVKDVAVLPAGFVIV